MEEELIDIAVNEPVYPISFPAWVVGALGWKYTFLLAVAGVLAFVLTLNIVRRGKGQFTTAALFLIVPLPLFVGLAGAVESTIDSLNGLHSSDDSLPRLSTCAGVIVFTLFPTLVGLYLTAPSYLVAMFGLYSRSMQGDAEK